MTLLRIVLCLALLFSLTPVIANTRVDAENIVAKWQFHQLRFHYAGFTSDYSCDGVRSKVKLLLRAIGARDDVKVEGSCTGNYMEVQPFHNMRLAFAVPVLAEVTDISEETFPAKWEKVRLTSSHPRDLDGGDCELVEQFSDQVLSKLETRELDDESSCIPHQRTLNSPDLRITVLRQQQADELEPAK